MNILKSIDIKNFGQKKSGKTRDYYIVDGKRILISTDRISAFDRILGYIPYKGQVLTQLAAFWFEKTKDIIPNHIVANPDPNVLVVKNCELIPIEMVVRGYITGVTGTSIWGSYEKGERVIYGIGFPEGLRKNQHLLQPIITPTTKAEVGHDERLTRQQIIDKKIVTKEIYEQMETVTLRLFERGTEICEKAGIILVDTKYEFGLLNGELVLIDEIHTPDSSRFWIKKTYQQRFNKREEPENFDKEFVRLWFKKKGYVGEGKPPKMTEAFINQVSKRYIDIYEKITNKKFNKSKTSIPTRIKKNLKNYFENQPIKLAVLISNGGTGTNLQAILDAVKARKINAEVTVVISDAEDAYGITRAKKYNVAVEINKDKNNLLSLLQKYNIDYIALAGWKQMITEDVLQQYQNKILNIHPGLIPDVVKNPDGTPGIWNKGKYTEKAIQNFLDNNATYAGSSVHFLSDTVDFGEVLTRAFVKINKADTVDTLYKKLKEKENKIYIDALKKICNTKKKRV
jgi:phosphoribosylaminoimidazole-succinocarboxamide synthase